jgi:hypothetical protein
MSQIKAPSYVAPISPEDYNNLSSETVTKKNYDRIVAQIDERFDYVFNMAMLILDRQVGWYAYGNAPEGEDQTGNFDPDEYEIDIDFIGDIRGQTHGLYDDSIPTRWLFEDFEEPLKAEIESVKQKKADKKAQEKKTKADRKARRKSVIASIHAKLTPEELSFINFKPE